MPMINTALPGEEDENVNYKQMLLRQLQAQNNPPPEEPNNNALVAGLNQSFSKLGTVGGKSADTSDVTRYANVLDQMKAARQQQDLAKTGQQEKILGMLAQLKDKDKQKANALSSAKQIKDEDREYQANKTKEDQAFQIQLAKVKGDQSLAQALAVANAKNGTNGDGLNPKLNLTPGQKKTDENFSKEYDDFIIKGGYGQVQKGIKQLNDVADMLKKDKSLTGAIQGLTPDFVNSFKNPDAIKARKQVEDVVQKSLKEVLGAQFTENEGKQILARAYDPSASTETNRENVLRLVETLQRAAESKLNASKYYEEYGTLAPNHRDPNGFRGTVANSADDLLPDLNRTNASTNLATKNPEESDIKTMGMGQSVAPAQSAAPKPHPKLDAQAKGSKKVVKMSDGTTKTYTKGADGLWYEE